MHVLRYLRRGRIAALAATAALVIATPAIFSADPELRPDYRAVAYAITSAKVVPSPGVTIDSGTVVIRQGVIEAVGKTGEVPVPADAEVIDGKGLVLYPGFIDLYSTIGVSSTAVRSQTGPGRTIPYSDFALPRTPLDNRTGLTPEFEVASALELTDSIAEERRKLGFTDILIAPGGAIASGQSALVSLSGLPRREAILKSPVGLHVLLGSPGGNPFAEGHDCTDDVDELDQYRATAPAPAPPEDPIEARRRAMRSIGYPMSLMGVIAHLRQAFLDSEFDHASGEYYEKQGGVRPSNDPALRALFAAKTKTFPTFYEANSRDEIHRVLDLSAEFGTTPIIVGGREAAKVADRLKSEAVPVILKLDFPEEPKAPTEAEFRKRDNEGRDVPLRVLVDRAARWKERVATAALLQKAGVKFAFSSDGIKQTDSVHAQVRKLIAAGLPVDVAIASLTRTAAEIAGLEKRIGTIEKGKLGHIVALSAPYENEKSKPRFVFADGMKFDLEKNAAAAKKGGAEGKSRDSRTKSDAATDKEKTDSTAPPKGEEDQPTKPEAAKTKEAAKPDPSPAPPQDVAKEKAEPAKVEAPAPKSEMKDRARGDDPAKGEAPAKKADDPPFRDVPSEFDTDRLPKFRTGGDVFIKDATILTVSKAGTIAKGSILIRKGKIEAIGEDLTAPEGVPQIDATGLVAMPGIIDTHSHMAIQGGVNEMTLSIVPEVRVADVVDGEDPTIYNALGGGTTTARLLHGSANTIGGQDVVIKLRYGLTGKDLILKDDRRPQGVKFALGENVTRSRGRFPNTRMGVEATIERAFLEGQAYARDLADYEAKIARGEKPPPFRRDLRLEALSRILNGSIKIHSHCYRADEILMLLRTAERFGVRVQSLQHVLEGYKVAAEIAAHGASASTFSDWWAYKIEAYNAIPYNAALLTEAGARVCIKSDSEELVRHLYHEASKMVKYGAVSEAQALEMITMNPARELGIEHRVGSLEVGKDGDVALFNAHPFDTFSRCQISLVDGEVRFLRKEADGKFAPRAGEKKMPGPDSETRSRPLVIGATTKGTYAIVGATLHPVSGPDLIDGTLVISGDKIVAIGGPDTPIPPDAVTIDGKGLDVWPGMIDSGSVVGLFEIGSVPETQDIADSAQFQPELRTSVAIHPDSELIPVTRVNGILSSYLQPTGGSISGQGCLASFAGWVPSEMVVRDGVALNVTIPAYSPPRPDGRPRFSFGGGANDDPNSKRKEKLEAISDQFKAALEYDRVVQAAKAGKAANPAPDPRLSALVPFARGEKPVIFVADRRIEILDALKLASDLKLKAVITGGGEAWKVTDELKAAKVPVLVSGTLRVPPDRHDPYDAAYTNPARLHAAGIPFAIRSMGQGPDQATAARNLPFEAGTAVAYGLPEAEAIKAVTLAPAQILGVADTVGSLEVGKRADLVVTQGPLLQVTSEIKALFIGGRPISLRSRHTDLYGRYRERLSDVRSGKAKLGLQRSGPTAAAPPVAPATPASSTGSAGAGAGERR